MNIFVDLGSHYGNIIRRFMASRFYSKDFIFYAFEPNPVIPETVFMSYPKTVTIFRQAAWIFDGEMDFYLNPNPRFQGATLDRNKTTGWLDKKHPVKVKCIDFSTWMRQYLGKEDNVIMKCNIEGAEYPLLDKLMAEGTIELIKQLYLRRHWHKIGMLKEKDDEFIARLSKYNVKVFNKYEF